MFGQEGFHVAPLFGPCRGGSEPLFGSHRLIPTKHSAKTATPWVLTVSMHSST